MNIATGTIQTLTVELTIPEARAFLGDPGPTQDAVRRALVAFHNSAAEAEEPRVRAKRGRAAGGKKSESFLAASTFKCINCGRAFHTKHALNIHRSRAHDSKGAAAALAADGNSAE